jgi:glycosyltransferase involved in cell wall biosynthesis
MAVYNGEPHVSGAVESVLGQTHADLEFIVVDDRSTDRTREIVEGYARRDPRVRLLVNPKNIDQPASLNRALAAARYEWVAVIDADDAWMPRRLEEQLRALESEPSIRVLGTYAINIDQRGVERGLKAVGPRSVEEFKRLVKNGGQISLVHPSALMHRPTILAVGGYDPAFGPSADTELWSRVSDRHVIVSLTEPLLYYRVHQNSMSSTRFFEQRRTLRYIRVRQKARRRGLPVPAVKELESAWHTGISLRRLNYARADWGYYFLMHSSMRWHEGRRPRALLLRAAAAALTPREVLARLWPGNTPD